MKINANAQAIYNAFQSQQVSANNIANVNTNGFKASTAVQSGDKVSISPEAAAMAAASASGSGASEELSTTDPVKDMVSTEINETAVSANVSVIQTQQDMNRVMFGQDDPNRRG